MLTEPITARYDVGVDTVASIFSLLSSGVLAGTTATFSLIEKASVERMMLITYPTVFFYVLIMHLSPDLWLAMAAMTLVGFCGEIGLYVAETVVVSV